jgi:hypothetical protein
METTSSKMIVLKGPPSRVLPMSLKLEIVEFNLSARRCLIHTVLIMLSLS